MSVRCSSTVFFFQAEDGIRDGHVTGVQTCALPISPDRRQLGGLILIGDAAIEGIQKPPRGFNHVQNLAATRSEERRVGKEWRCRWWRCDGKRKRKDRRNGRG